MRARFGVLGGVMATLGCGTGPAAQPAPGPAMSGSAPSPADAGSGPEVLACFDLPRDDLRSHNLSGLAWDPAAQQLFALSDRVPTLTVLVPSADLASFALAPSIALAITVPSWDGEAVAIAADRFLIVANETAPAVFSVDRAGHDAQPLALPFHEDLRHNLGLESLAYVTAAKRRYVFAANEQAREADGPGSGPDHGTVVRLARYSLDGEPVREVAYLTDPVFAEGLGDLGVSDLVALTPDRVLVLERGWVKDAGNSIRLYDVELRDAVDIASLGDARRATPAAKRLVADLATVDDRRCSAPPAPQRNKILENYEGLAVGPALGDGRRVLFMVSDDNDNPLQPPRVIALAVALDR